MNKYDTEEEIEYFYIIKVYIMNVYDVDQLHVLWFQ